jgi:hypothetical protein
VDHKLNISMFILNKIIVYQRSIESCTVIESKIKVDLSCGGRDHVPQGENFFYIEKK